MGGCTLDTLLWWGSRGTYGCGWWGTVTEGLRVCAKAPGKLPGGCPTATGAPSNPTAALGLPLVCVGNYK